MPIRTTFGRYHSNDINSSYDTSNALNEIDNKIDNTVITQIPGLEDEINAFDARVTTVEGEVTTLGAEVATLEGDVATLTGDIGGFATPADVNTAILDFGNTINLFDKTKITANTFLQTDGSTIGATGTHMSDYMAISALNPIISNHAEIYSGFTANGPIFYDATKTMVGRANNFDGINPITAPIGAVYCRVNVLGTILDNYMLLRGATLPDHYIPWGMTSSKRVITESVASAREMHPFGDVTSERVGQRALAGAHYVFEEIHAPGYIAGTTYSTGDGSAATGSIWDTTGYFPVPPGGQITTIGWHDDYAGIGGYGITYWDVDKKFVSGLAYAAIAAAGGLTQAVLTVPAQAYYARLTVNPTIDAYDNTMMARTMGIVWGNQPNYDHKFKSVPSLVNMHRPWTNKRWMVAGDSLSADGFSRWFRRVAEYHGVKYIKNCAVGGRFMHSMLNDTSSIEGVALPAGYFADVDCAFMLGGTNSIGFDHIPLGAITDTPNIAGNWYPALRAWVEHVLTDNPYCRVVLGTVAQRNGPTFAESAAYAQAVRDVAALYSVRVFDTFAWSQLSPMTWTAYTTDSVHAPDDEGFTRIFGSNLAAFMHQVFPLDFLGDPLYGGFNYNRP